MLIIRSAEEDVKSSSHSHIDNEYLSGQLLGIPCLIDKVRENPQRVRSVNLSFCHRYESCQLLALFDSLHQCENLTVLDLSCCNLDERVIPSLVKLCRARLSIKLVRLAGNFLGLRSIDILLTLSHAHVDFGDNECHFDNNQLNQLNNNTKTTLDTALSVLIQTGQVPSSIPSVTQLLPGMRCEDMNLDVRDKEILFHLVRGKTAKMIARILELSYRTIEHRLEKIKYKFGVSSKAELIDKITGLL